MNDVSAYGADSIAILEGLDVVRKRPGMYIGSTGVRGLHHMVWEVVDNAVDEAMAGYADRVNVRLLADGGVEVVDNGRGIPVAMHSTGIPTIDVVMTQLHAGGKFDADGGAYAVSGGLHGVGVSVVNALSTALEVEIKRDGYLWSQRYVRSEPQSLTRNEPTDDTGTTVRFWSDPDVFEVVDYDLDTVARRLQEMAFLNGGLTVTLSDERTVVDEPQESIVYCYPAGLTDFVRQINRTKTSLHENIIGFSGEGPGYQIEVAMQWNTSYTQSLHTFANTINTHEGGTHEEGFRTALTTVMNKYARDHKLIKAKDDNLSGDDIREGLAAVVSVKISEPQFEGQTKTRLGNSEVKSFVQRMCHEKLTEWFESHSHETKVIVEKAAASSRARIAARKARELVRRKSANHIGGLPGKLADCRSSDPSRCEIYIVEGDSAGGSAKSGRDSMFQAILPLRGKIINVEKSRIDRVLANTEVQSIITAFGTGIHDEFDITKLRYHKIVLMLTPTWTVSTFRLCY